MTDDDFIREKMSGKFKFVGTSLNRYLRKQINLEFTPPSGKKEAYERD